MSKAINIDLIFLSKLQTKNLPKVTTTEIMSEDDLSFHEEGLFSTEIFGHVGTEERVKQLGQIDLNMDVLHPLQFKNLISLDSLYKDIFYGKAFATFNEEQKNFVKADVLTGETGYSFFIKHMNDLIVPRDKSDLKDTETGTYKLVKERQPGLPKERDFKIDLLYIYRDMNKVRFRNLLVLEAGIRDYKLDEEGNASEDEINDLYRKVISISNMVKNFDTSFSNGGLDTLRLKQQLALVDIYDYIIGMLKGKNKFIEDKYTKRATDNGTFNVLTSLPSIVESLNSPAPSLTFNHTIVGLHQALRAIAPLARYQIRERFTSKLFSETSKMGKLVDKKTLRTVQLEIHEEDRDYFLSNEGLDKLMAKIKAPEMINLPIEVDGHYLMLIYDKGNKVAPIFDTSIISEEDLKHCRPITYGEMLYMATASTVLEYPGIITRFPITDVGSTYPTMTYLKVTIESRKVDVLNEFLEPTGEFLEEFPINTSKHFGSMVVDTSRLDALGADN